MKNLLWSFIFFSFTVNAQFTHINEVAMDDVSKLNEISKTNIREFNEVLFPYYDTYYCDFGGTDEYALSANDVMKFNNSSFTFSCWVYIPSSYVSVVAYFLNYRYGVNDYFYCFKSAFDYWNITIRTASTTNLTTIATASFPFDQWVHLVFVANYNGSGYLYQDGVDVTNGSISCGTYNMNQTATLSMNKFSASYYNIDLDDIAIYTKALSTTEVALLYGNGVVSGDVKGGNPKWISDLRYLCSFNKVTSFPTIPDDSGNGYGGTAYNMESGDITGF